MVANSPTAALAQNNNQPFDVIECPKFGLSTMLSEQQQWDTPDVFSGYGDDF